MNEQAPNPHGGFPNQEAQLANTAFRGMGADATVAEVNAHDQMKQDLVNAEHFGYPLGTPSVEIGQDIFEGRTPKSD